MFRRKTAFVLTKLRSNKCYEQLVPTQYEADIEASF